MKRSDCPPCGVVGLMAPTSISLSGMRSDNGQARTIGRERSECAIAHGCPIPLWGRGDSLERVIRQNDEPSKCGQQGYGSRCWMRDGTVAELLVLVALSSANTYAYMVT